MGSCLTRNGNTEGFIVLKTGRPRRLRESAGLILDSEAGQRGYEFFSTGFWPKEGYYAEVRDADVPASSVVGQGGIRSFLETFWNPARRATSIELPTLVSYNRYLAYISCFMTDGIVTRLFSASRKL